MNSKISKFLLATFVNTIVGMLFSILLDLPIWIGIASLNLLGYITPALKLPSHLRAGVHVEAWTNEVVKEFTHKEQGTFLDGVPDYSQYASNDVIHISDVSGDPDVLINNTTYPLTPKAMDNGDIAISLAKFETEPTFVTDDELHAIAFDKMSIVKERHGNKLGEAHLDKAIHAFAPAAQADDTPVIFTTGDVVDGRRKMRRIDIISMRRHLDKLGVPKEDRRLVLSNDHINDLLEDDQKFQNQYHNYETGVIAKMYGFEIYEFVNCPLYGQDLTKKAFGAIAGEGDFQASVFFYVKRMFKAKGSTKMYYSDAATDPLNKRNLVSFTNRFVAMAQKTKAACGAIVSKQQA